ncbi:hypothetical protein [Micromonospora sp. NBC_01813]|uniref:hypothetical protein n=1 Tax=Micromonospora sp. NBC_01813 TaxID=2975988 RepID=UPI002DDB0185|nr:hypothetical protein [Micromonospora sp. NBC_01813]WSA07850.1 hypothetical protein OG958_27070 [Micromonospora sp. NBC_01813]
MVALDDQTEQSSAGFEDPQAEQAQEGDQGEVVRVRGRAGGGDQGFELEMAQSEGR